jgi:hypothetical protein
MAYETVFFSDGATFHVNEGQSRLLLLAIGTASGTQPTKAVANAE